MANDYPLYLYIYDRQGRYGPPLQIFAKYELEHRMTHDVEKSGRGEERSENNRHR